MRQQTILVGLPDTPGRPVLGWVDSTRPELSYPIVLGTRLYSRRDQGARPNLLFISDRTRIGNNAYSVEADKETKAYPRLQAEGFDRMSNRIRLISADLRHGGGLQAAVGRARLDRYTSAWRPKPRQRPTLALSTSREDDPAVPAGLRGPSLRLKARGFTIPDGDTKPRAARFALQPWATRSTTFGVGDVPAVRRSFSLR